MPLPKPSSSESREDFINRCMANGEMNSEFPDSQQRAAVCFSKWREKVSKQEDITVLVAKALTGKRPMKENPPKKKQKKCPKGKRYVDGKCV